MRATAVFVDEQKNIAICARNTLLTKPAGVFLGGLDANRYETCKASTFLHSSGGFGPPPSAAASQLQTTVHWRRTVAACSGREDGGLSHRYRPGK